jgi:hypothetical protein
MLPNTQLDQKDSVIYHPDSASISDRFFKKKPAGSDKTPSNHNGLLSNSVMDPPVIPYCLRQARGSSPAGPFAAPVPGNHQAPQSPTNTPLPAADADITLDMRLFLDSSHIPAMIPDRAMPMSMVFGNYGAATEGNTEAQVQTAIVPSHTGSNVFDPYASTYVYSNEHAQVHWGHPGQRNGYA